MSIRSARSAPAFALLLSVPLAWWAGLEAGQSGPRHLAVQLMAGAGAAVAVLPVLKRRFGAGILAVELPILLLVASGMVWRIRTSDALLNDPLDSAGKVRVLAVGLAGLLGALALVSARRGGRNPVASLPFQLYLGYVVVVWSGVLLSVHPLFTAYRAVELTTVLVVFAGACAVAGADASARIGRILFWYCAASLVTVWIEAMLMPDRAFSPFLNTQVPLKYEIAGVYPSIAANSVGFLGVILLVWSLAGPPAFPSGKSITIFWRCVFGVIGFASIVAAQYRTGYLCLAAVLFTWLLLSRRYELAGLVGALTLAAFLAFQHLPQSALPFLLRGQSVQEAEQLSGRIDFWQAAIPIWQQSPWLGRGLLTGSRFEVLSNLGFDKVSSLHSTWIEALLGTGIVGVTFLAATYLVTLKRAAERAVVERQGSRDLLPLLFLIAFAVRSITGTSIEVFQYEEMIFLWLVLSLSEKRRPIRAPAMRDDRQVYATSP